MSGEHESWLERVYQPTLRWVLDSAGHRWAILGVAVISLVIGGALFASRPQAFLPSFGEPQIAVSISLPGGTKIADTNGLVRQFEEWVETDLSGDEIGTVQTTIGSGGGLESLILGGTSVSENVAQITIGVHHQDKLDACRPPMYAPKEEIFGKDNVTVSAASLSEQGFGGFALVLSGPQAETVRSHQQRRNRHAQRCRWADQRQQQSGTGGRGVRRECPRHLHPRRPAVGAQLHR
ncbi:MAG: efflux RND transporter permease subunit [Anaerolineae bacterium]